MIIYDEPIKCIPSPGETCPEEAKWYIWFEECGGFYGHVCDKHAADAIVNGVNGYRVSQLQSIEDERRRIAARDAKRAEERRIEEAIVERFRQAIRGSRTSG